MELSDIDRRGIASVIRDLADDQLVASDCVAEVEPSSFKMVDDLSFGVMYFPVGVFHKLPGDGSPREKFIRELRTSAKSYGPGNRCDLLALWGPPDVFVEYMQNRGDIGFVILHPECATEFGYGPALAEWWDVVLPDGALFIVGARTFNHVADQAVKFAKSIGREIQQVLVPTGAIGPDGHQVYESGSVWFIAKSQDPAVKKVISEVKDAFCGQK